MSASARWIAVAAFATAGVVAVAGVVAYVGQHGHRSAPSAAGTALSVRLDECARPDGDLASGTQDFAVTNTTSRSLEIAVVGAGGAMFAELEGVAPGVTRSMPVGLAAGTYHLECYFAELPRVSGAAFAVTGGADRPTVGIVPVSAQDLTPIALGYQAWIAARLPELRTAVGALIAAPDVDAQRAAWSAAHRIYGTLGAAYDAFGDRGTAIESEDKGFLAIEATLWAPEPTVPTELERGLAAEVDGLIADFPAMAVDPRQLGLRAHEITENTIEFTLSGSDEHGSHTPMDTALAGLTGTRELLDRLKPLLDSRYRRLGDTYAALDTAVAVATATARQQAGRPVTDYPPADRARLNAAFGGLAELLAPIATIADVRRTR